MVVLFDNRLWNLDMSFYLFKRLQVEMPEHKVYVEELCSSLYSERRSVPLKELKLEQSKRWVL